MRWAFFAMVSGGLAATLAMCNVYTPGLLGKDDAAADSPAVACEAGLVACGIICADIMSDPKHCGRCGHDCQGGACVGRMCQPVTLASDEDNPTYIAVDATNVYWTNMRLFADAGSLSGAVRKVPLGGGMPVTLATNEISPKGIAVDATSVYWSSGPTVMKLPLAGGSAVILVSLSQNGSDAGFNYPWSVWEIAVDGTSVYWTAQRGDDGGALMKLPLGGGMPVTLATNEISPTGIAVDATSVYWTSSSPSGGTVRKVPLDGGTPVTLASGQNYPWGVAVDATSVYWTNLLGGTVRKVPLDGGTPVTLASGQNRPRGIAVDATSVYWTNEGSGMVMMVPLGGGTLVTLASGQSAPWGIAVDATSVYWTNTAGSSVMKVAKP